MLETHCRHAPPLRQRELAADRESLYVSTLPGTSMSGAMLATRRLEAVEEINRVRGTLRLELKRRRRPNQAATAPAPAEKGCVPPLRE